MIPKKDVEFEKEAAHVRVIETEILSPCPGHEPRPFFVREGPWDVHDSTLLLLLVLHTHTHTHPPTRGYACARALESAYEPRLGSANRDSQHTIRGELNIPISSGTFERLFSTLRLARSVSSFRTRAFWRYWDCATIIRNYGNKDD